MTIASTKTVGEIAAGLPSSAREFEKLGIDYCCGGSRTLGEACAEAKISVDEALARLEKSTEAQGSQNAQTSEGPIEARSSLHVFRAIPLVISAKDSGMDLLTVQRLQCSHSRQAVRERAK